MSTGDEMIKRWRERMYGKPEDVLTSFNWQPGLKPECVELMPRGCVKTTLHGYHEGWRDRELSSKKPFLTARDLIFLREMRISL